MTATQLAMNLDPPEEKPWTVQQRELADRYEAGELSDEELWELLGGEKSPLNSFIQFMVFDTLGFKPWVYPFEKEAGIGDQDRQDAATYLGA